MGSQRRLASTVRRRRPIPVIRSATPSSPSHGTSNPVLGRPPAVGRLEGDETPDERDREVEVELRPDADLPFAGGPGVSEGPPEPEPDESALESALECRGDER
jgi:hypothetical protein